MLNQPPPPTPGASTSGYNAPAVNDQNVQQLEVPGNQGLQDSNYLANQFRSSYETPSSYSVPSSIPVPQPFYNQPQQQQQTDPNAAMVHALSKGAL